MSNFIFNGMNSDSLSLSVLGERTYNLPDRRVTAQGVYGRSGALLIDEKAYNNIQQVYSCTLDASEYSGGIDEALALLAAQLHVSGYKKLTDSWHPGTFRLASFSSALDVSPLKPVENAPHRMANFDISFNCKPQRYLDSGDVLVQNAATLTNPTAFDAYPLIEVSGAGTYTIGDFSFTVLNGAGSVTIDCETMDAYSGTENKNNFIELPLENIVIPGGATVSITGSMDVKPRWWRL